MTRRDKFFGQGTCVPLDREAKIKILHRAKALMHRTKKGKHYGAITAKAFAVLRALLYGFHNARSGRCFPSYEAIAMAADCARSTVHEAISMLEQANLITWHHRLKRVREAAIVRVLRSSNAYRFLGSPSGSVTGSDHQPGTPIKVFSSMSEPQESDLNDALSRLAEAFQKKLARH